MGSKRDEFILMLFVGEYEVIRTPARDNMRRGLYENVGDGRYTWTLV